MLGFRNWYLFLYLFTDMGFLSLLAGSEVPFILACDCYAPDGGSGKKYVIHAR